LHQKEKRHNKKPQDTPIHIHLTTPKHSPPPPASHSEKIVISQFAGVDKKKRTKSGGIVNLNRRYLVS
jgi:hypothetical protein